MTILAWIVLGLVAGWLAGMIYDYAGFYAAAFTTGLAINAAHIVVIGVLVWRQGRLRLPSLARA